MVGRNPDQKKLHKTHVAKYGINNNGENVCLSGNHAINIKNKKMEGPSAIIIIFIRIIINNNFMNHQSKELYFRVEPQISTYFWASN